MRRKELDKTFFCHYFKNPTEIHWFPLSNYKLSDFPFPQHTTPNLHDNPVPVDSGDIQHLGWLISKLIPQNSDDTEVLTITREKIEPQMEGSVHITVRGLPKCDCLGSCSAVMLHSSLYWLGNQTGSYRCCQASQRAVTFSMGLTEKQEIC